MASMSVFHITWVACVVLLTTQPGSAANVLNIGPGGDRGGGGNGVNGGNSVVEPPMAELRVYRDNGNAFHRKWDEVFASLSSGNFKKTAEHLEPGLCMRGGWTLSNMNTQSVGEVLPGSD